MSKPAPPIHIRLTEDCGSLPQGFVFLVPREEAIRLIARRKATAVGSLKSTPDLVVTADVMEAATA